MTEDSNEAYVTDDVFGETRTIPLNYVVRNGVDGTLMEELGRHRHIVIYGSSKQRKTCLRKECLREDEYIAVNCSNRWGLRDLHSTVLKRAGFNVKVSETQTVSGTNKVLAEAGGAFMGIGAKAGADETEEETRERTPEPLELDVEDVNDVIRALESIDFDKYIVLAITLVY